MTLSVRLGNEREEIIKKLNINFSEFVREIFDKRYKSLEILNKEIDELKEQILARERLIKEIEDETGFLTDEELAYLKESKVIIQTHGEHSKFFENRYKAYLKQFNKTYLTINKFKEMSLSS